MSGLVTLMRRIFSRQVEAAERALTLDDVSTALENTDGRTYLSMRYDNYVLRESVAPYVVNAPAAELALYQMRLRLLARMNEDLRPRVVARKVGP